MIYKVKLVYISHINELYRPGTDILNSLAMISLKRYCESLEEIRRFTEFTLVTCTDAEDETDIAGLVMEGQPDMVALSCYVWNITFTLRVAELIRRKDKNIEIILGGPQIENTKDILGDYPFINTCVRGEGEILFSEIILSKINGKKTPRLPGIAFRDGDSIEDIEGRGLISDLNCLPSLYNEETLKLFTSPSIFYQTARGCVSRCKYCHTALSNMRFRNISTVERELKLILRSGKFEYLSFLDSELGFNMERMKSILTIIDENRIDNMVTEGNYGFFDVDDKLLALLRKLDFWAQVGIQTTSPEANALLDRSKMFRMSKREKELQKALLSLKPNNVSINLIMGLPGDTFESHGEALKSCQRIGASNVTAMQFLVLPGTYFEQNAGEFGIEFEKEPFHRVLQNTTFPREDIEKARSCLYWYSTLYQEFSREELVYLSSREIYIWDVVQKLPYLSAERVAPYFKDQDSGIFKVKADKTVQFNRMVSIALKKLGKVDKGAEIMTGLLEKKLNTSH